MALEPLELKNARLLLLFGRRRGCLVLVLRHGISRGFEGGKQQAVGGSVLLTSSVLSCVFCLSDAALSAGPSLSVASSFLSPFDSFSFFFFCFSSYSFLTRSTSSSSSRFLRASMAAWSIFGVQKPVSFRCAGQT